MTSWLPSLSEAARALLASAVAPGGGPLGVGGAVGLDLDRLGLGAGQRGRPVGLALGGELGLVALGLGQRALPVGLGVGRPADLGFEALGGQLGLALGQGGLLLGDLLGGLGLGQGAGLGGLGVGLLGLGLESGPLDGDVPLVLGLQGGRLLLPLGGLLVGLGGGDAGRLATAAAWGAARLLM